MAKNEDKKGRKSKDAEVKTKRITVELAPGVRKQLETYLADFNSRPDRTEPVLKYTDVVNRALDSFLPAPKSPPAKKQ